MSKDLFFPQILFNLFSYLIKDSFNVLSYYRVKTLIQSRNLLYLIFNLPICSLVIKIAIVVIKAEQLDNTTPMLGLIKDIVEVPIANPDPNKISVTINITFYLFNDLYFFL